MDSSQVTIQRINQLLNEILSPDAVERHEAFERLCACLSDAEVDHVYHSLLSRGDTQSLYWLLEYLVAIESPAGFKKLWQLLNHDHEAVRVQARQSVLKVDEKARIDLLLHLLQSERPDDLCFATKGLGDAAAPKAIYPLLDVMSSAVDPKVRISTVLALEKLRDPQALGVLTNVVKNEKGEIQEIAFRASVNLLLESGKSSFLKKYVHSESASIRQVAYLAMLRVQGIRWERYIARILCEEKEAGLKVRMMASIRAIRTSQMFEAIFEASLNDETMTVRMVAQSVLKRIKNGMILKALIRKAQSRESAVQELAVRLISEYSGSSEASRPLMRIFERTDSLRLRLIVLNTLGEMKNSMVRDFVFHKVLAGEPYSRGAAVAFVRTARACDWDKIETVLSGGSLPSKGLATVLNFIAHLPQQNEIPQKIKDQLRKLMDHPDKDIRYQAVRCLPQMQATDILRKLLMIAALDPDRGVKFAAVRTLLEILKKDPSKLTFLASLSLTFREVYAVVCDIFRRIPARTESNFLEILKSVLPQIQQARQTHALDRLKDAMRLLLLIRNLAEGEKTIFMNCFRIPSWSGGEKILLLKILNRMSLYEYSGLNIDFMIQDYSRVDADAKREYLRFFGKLVYPSSKVRDLLCDALQGEPDEKLRNRIYRVLAAQFRELSEWPASEGAL